MTIDVGMQRTRPLLAAFAFLAIAALPSLVRAQSGPSPDPIGALSMAEPVAATNESTRFVILLEKHSDVQVRSLQNPNRVIVELSTIKLVPPEVSQPIGLIKSSRWGLSGPGRTQVVIEVSEPVVVEEHQVKANDGRGERLVLDMTPAKSLKLAGSKSAAGKIMPSPSGLGAQGIQPPLPTRVVRSAVKAQKNHKDIIVIDPGHGGNDSGAVKNGTVEKDVVLAFSLALKAKLEASGRYVVFMTRATDIFIPLDERRKFAEDHQANLFIAVHADEAQPHARGATIYSLRESVAEQLRRSAKGQSGSNSLSQAEMERVHSSGDPDLAQMLSELAGREVDATKKRASIFSQEVIEYMGADTTLHDEPDRTAAFRVLKTAKVPAVLIELAYVSNEQDAKLLKSDQWRDKVSGSIVTAIDNYFASPIAHLPM